MWRGSRRRRGLGSLFLAAFLLGLVWQGQAPSPKADPETVPPPAPSPQGIHGRRGVYLTSYSLARPGFLEGILDTLQAHGLDTVVVNVKNMHGEVCYPTRVELARAIGAVAPRLDLAAILAAIHARGMYAIARQVVFYDPQLAAHLGAGGEWVLPTDEAAVAYNVAIAQELAELGFDELQLDYVRFPDGGGIGADYSARCAAVEAFLARVKEALTVPLSVDIFGRVLWPWNARRIDPIGQHLEGMARFVDVFSPMIYPSHYVEQKLKDDPYGTVKLALEHGMARVETPMRPFLQAFDMAIPAGMTLPEYIAAQIRAAEEVGADGYLFWNPATDYSALWQALELMGGPEGRSHSPSPSSFSSSALSASRSSASLCWTRWNRVPSG